MTDNFLKVFLFGLLFLLIQVVFLQHLSLFGANADIVFIYSLWIMVHHDRYKSLIMIFILAFLQDWLLDYWGLNMLSKVLFAYIAHRTISSFKDSNLMAGQVFLFLAVSSAIFTLFYLGIANFSGRFAVTGHFLVLWITGTIYTTLVGFITHLLRTK